MADLFSGASAQITPFNFGTHAVRVIVREDEPWFVAADVCGALGYVNPRKAVADHLDADEKGVTNGDTLGGKQSLTIINESGLYALVLRSRKPEARKFAKWVTGTVLPSIRKTGGYADPQQAEYAARCLGLARKVASALETEVYRSLMNAEPVDALAWQISLGWDAHEQNYDRPYIRTVQQMVSQWPNLIRDPGFHPSATNLSELVAACTDRFQMMLDDAGERNTLLTKSIDHLKGAQAKVPERAKPAALQAR